MPDVDLLWRTGNEQRTSNFLPWHTAYAELHFTPDYWPDIDRRDLWQAITEYTHANAATAPSPRPSSPPKATVRPLTSDLTPATDAFQLGETRCSTRWFAPGHGALAGEWDLPGFPGRLRTPKGLCTARVGAATSRHLTPPPLAGSDGACRRVVYLVCCSFTTSRRSVQG